MYRGKIVMEIEAAPDRIYEHLFHIDKWHWLLPHCQNVQLEKDDGREQIAIMEIKNGRDIERIRTVRHFAENQWITFDQTPPPAPLAVHRGKWTLEKNGPGTRVTVDHDIAAKNRTFSWFIERLAWMMVFRKNSLATLKQIKKVVAK